MPERRALTPCPRSPRGEISWRAGAPRVARRTSTPTVNPLPAVRGGGRGWGLLRWGMHYDEEFRGPVRRPQTPAASVLPAYSSAMISWNAAREGRRLDSGSAASGVSVRCITSGKVGRPSLM